MAIIDYDAWRADRRSIDAVEEADERGIEAADMTLEAWLASHYETIKRLYEDAEGEMRDAFEHASGLCWLGHEVSLSGLALLYDEARDAHDRAARKAKRRQETETDTERKVT